MAEGTRLLSEYGVNTPSRVRIPPSPLIESGPGDRHRERAGPVRDRSAGLHDEEPVAVGIAQEELGRDRILDTRLE